MAGHPHFLFIHIYVRWQWWGWIGSLFAQLHFYLSLVLRREILSIFVCNTAQENPLWVILYRRCGIICICAPYHVFCPFIHCVCISAATLLFICSGAIIIIIKLWFPIPFQYFFCRKHPATTTWMWRMWGSFIVIIDFCCRFLIFPRSVIKGWMMER